MTNTQGLIIAGIVLIAPHLSVKFANICVIVIVAALAAQWVYA